MRQQFYEWIDRNMGKFLAVIIWVFGHGIFVILFFGREFSVPFSTIIQNILGLPLIAFLYLVLLCVILLYFVGWAGYSMWSNKENVPLVPRWMLRWIENVFVASK